MFFFKKNGGVGNTFITPELYRDAKKCKIRNFLEKGFYRVSDTLLQVFRNKLDDPDLTLNVLYEFECTQSSVSSFKEDDFILPKFDLKIEFADQTLSDDVKKVFDSSNTVLMKTDKISAPSDLKKKLFSQGEKIRKLSKEIELKPLTLAYENFFLCDIENLITKTFVTELNQNILMYDLISFSGETKTDNKLHLISPSNKLKFNFKKDVYKNRVKFELGKVHTKMSFSTTQDNVVNFDILCTRKNKAVG